jgi:3-hydroxyisobutyrate dehydrogenase-like beta-hydroxyacid dehydrogenase
MLDLAHMTRVLGLQGVMEGVPASKDYKGGFACKLMSKDLGLAAAAAQHCNAKVPMSEEAARLYQQVMGKVPSANC